MPIKIMLLIVPVVMQLSVIGICAEKAEKILFYGKSHQQACHVYEKYVVWTDMGEEADSGRFQVISRGTDSKDSYEMLCSQASSTVNTNNFNGYFSGLAGQYILNDRGSSTGMRGLGVIDIVIRKEILADVYNTQGGIINFDKDEIVYWRDTNKPCEGALRKTLKDWEWSTTTLQL